MKFLTDIIDSIISIIGDLGYLGIFVGMTLESTLVPLPSELILPPAGVLVSQGEMSFMLVLIASTLGSLMGAYINYAIGLHFGRRIMNKLVSKYGKFLFIKPDTLEKVDNYFKSHGNITTFTGRLIPGVRHLISLPAGFSRMPLGKFTLYTTLGAGIWSAILIFLGIFYGNNKEKVDSLLGSITVLIFVFLLIILLIYFYKRKSKK